MPPRNLTPRVYQEWYRPPEVIIDQDDYKFSSDIWNIGCIMAECAKLTSQYQQQKGSAKKRLSLKIQQEQWRYLFLNRSINQPVSPSSQSTSPRKSLSTNLETNETNQMEKIISFLGGGVDLSFIQNENMKESCQSLQKKFTLCNSKLKAEFHQSSAHI